MADERDNPNNPQDQEYSFPDKPSEEFGKAAHTGGTEDILSILRNKRVLVAVGGVVGLYILISLISGSDDTDEVEVVETEVVQEVQAFDTEFDQMGMDTGESVSLFADLDDSMDKTSKTDEELDALKRQVASINRQNADFRTQLKQLDNKIDALTKSVERSVQQLSKVAKTQVSATAEKKVEIKQDYKIRAVISGRAWIEDKSGNNITVKVGDAIPTYGRVTKIMPVEGIVETSSGRRITFSHND